MTRQILSMSGLKEGAFVTFAKLGPVVTPLEKSVRHSGLYYWLPGQGRTRIAITFPVASVCQYTRTFGGGSLTPDFRLPVRDMQQPD